MQERFERLSWAGPLVARLVAGVLFTVSGWGKIHGLTQFTAYLGSLGIPAPHLTAPFVAWVEFVYGAFLVAGFCCRLASLALLIDMIVALATVKLKGVTHVGDILYLPEVQLCALFFWLMVEGAGRISVDFEIRRFFVRHEEPVSFRKAA
jgi:putative oxidoreductase